MSSSQKENTRIYNRLPVAREGFPFIFIGVALTLLLLVAGLFLLTIFA